MSYNYSEILDEKLSRDDPLFWNGQDPVDYAIIRIIGIVLCISLFIGILLNGSIIYSFIRYKDLRTSSLNIFIMFITIIGFFASFSILPLTGISSIYYYWLFYRIGCKFEAIMAFLYACSTSYLLYAVSLTRSYIIIRLFNAKTITVIHIFNLIIFSLTKFQVMTCVIFSIIAILIAFKGHQENDFMSNRTVFRLEQLFFAKFYSTTLTSIFLENNYQPSKQYFYRSLYSNVLS
jgi:hypothetical protein